MTGILKLFLASSILLMSSCSYIPYLGKLPPDNFAEEALEKATEEWLDMPEGSIDFSIFSPER